MAKWYVRSAAAGTATGADWTNAKTTLAAAFTAMAAGDEVYVSEDHAETQASAMTLTSPGTAASPCIVQCVNHAGTVPPVSADLRTTATISTTSTNSISFAGTAYCYGITFQAGSAANAANINLANANSSQWRWDSCGFTLNSTSASSRINLGGATTGMSITCRNCTWTFGSNASQGFTGPAGFVLAQIIGGSVVVGANVPTTLFLSCPGVFDLIGVDLSALGSGKTLIGASPQATRTRLQNCKIGASVTVAATPTTIQQETYLIFSDSSGTNYRNEKYHYTGTQTVETTIVRTGGASDGTTPIAWKIVTTANSKWVLPFEAQIGAIWNDTSGASKTVTVYGIWGGGAVPNTDDIWIEVEYLGASGNPQASIASSNKADYLAAGSALSSDSSTWGGSTTKFKMSVSFTPQQKGPFIVRVKAAKASSTFYIDPAFAVT